MKKITLVSFFFLLIFNLVSANTKIVYVDMNAIVSNSKPGSSILNQLNTLNKKNLENFKKKEKILKKKETKIISQKNVLAESEFQTNIEDLKLDIEKYNIEKKQSITNFNKIRIDNTNKLLKLINPILSDYSESNSIAIILQKKNIIVGKKELDVTNEIIQIIDENISEFTIK